jgi:zinc transporter, ZIP family
LSFAETVLLGAVAGITIYIGLPLGRMERVSERVRLALAMFSVGILAFIFIDVSSHGEAIIEATLATYKRDGTGLGHAIGLFALMAVGFTAGTAGIGTIERRLRNLRRPVPPPLAGGAQGTAIAVPRAYAPDAQAEERRLSALRTGMTIAVAIGLHNFAEGLAIGFSAKSGAIGLATVLVIGFALHNATEGFGIVGPLGGVKPPWRWLALAGLVGGGPTFLGTIVGFQVHSSTLQLAFYALAGGAILYVVGEIWTGVRRLGHRELGLYMLAFGFLLGIATDLVVSYGGA